MGWAVILLFGIACIQFENVFGYVEAVGASVDLAVGEVEMRVATVCDKSGAVYHNQYMDGNRQWVSDLERQKGCLETEQEVIEFCQLVYPGHSIARAVQSIHSYMISDWCKVGHNKCKESFWVKPYKCVQANGEPSGLTVPESCKLQHTFDHSKCQASYAWAMLANQSCKDFGMQLDSYAAQFPCGNDKYTKVEYVCCPRLSKKKKGSKKNSNLESSSVSEDDVSEESSTRDPYFTQFDPRVEHDAFRAAEQRLEASNRKKIMKIMKEWSDLEEKYQKIKSKNPVKAEKFKLKMTDRFNKMMNTIKDQGLAEKHQLIDLHQQRIIAHITERKKDGMKCYVKALNERPPSKSTISKCLNHLLRALFKDRHHTISHFNHMVITNPDQVQSQVAPTTTHLQDIERMVNESLIMLDRYPDIQLEVMPDVNQLIRELQRKDIIPAQLQIPTELKTQQEDTLPEPEVFADDIDVNRIDIDVEVERRPAAAVVGQHVDPLPAHFESHRHVHAEASFEERETAPPEAGRGGYVTLTLLSLALTVAVAAVVVARRRRRRTPRHAGFSPVHQPAATPEEKHLAHMQINGYENPTYRYFESK